MPYYKFGQNDIFNNNIETHPKCEFLIHDRKIYYNGYVSEPSSHSSESGEDNPNVKHIPSGYVSLYEINIDRQASLHGGTVSPTMAYQFITKDGSLGSFKTMTPSQFSSSMYGDVLTGSYPMSASLSVERYVGVDDCNNFPEATNLSRPRMTALKNTLNYYKYLSPHYDFSNFDDDKEVTLISIPSIFYGSSIEKGSVSLKYYITGSLAGELQDTKRNGELVQTSGGTSPNGSGLVAGVVLYNEGFIALTGDWSLDPLTSERYNWCPNAEPSNTLQCDQPRWKYWGQLGDPDETDTTPGAPPASLNYPIFHLDDTTPTFVNGVAHLTNSGTPSNSLYPATAIISHGGYSGTPFAGTYDEDLGVSGPTAAFNTAIQFNTNNPDITGSTEGTLLTVEIDDPAASISTAARAKLGFPGVNAVFIDGDLLPLENAANVTTIFEFTTDNDVIDGTTIGYNSGTTGDPSNTNINIGIANAPSDIASMVDDDIVPAVNNANIDIFAQRNGGDTIEFVQMTQALSGNNNGPYTYLDTYGYGDNGSGGKLWPESGNSYNFGGGLDMFPACADNDLCMDGDFTVDFWLQLEGTIRPNMWTPSGGTGDLSQGIISHDSNSFILVYVAAVQAIGTYAFVFATPSAPIVPGMSNIVIAELPAAALANNGLGTDWHHVALTRSGTQVTLFLDGDACTNFIMGTNTSYVEDADVNFHGLEFGDRAFLDRPFAGSIDELRFIKGTAIDFSSTGIPSGPASAGGGGGGIDTSYCVSSNVPNSSFDLSFNGTSYIPTVTMLAHAKKGELNHSNNPTFLTHGQSNAIISSTGSLYAENSELAIKNTVKSPYDGYEATFQKQTWISQIGIYDEDRNLIAIAKLANPVRKTEDREFTFKLKLDI